MGTELYKYSINIKLLILRNNLLCYLSMARSVHFLANFPCQLTPCRRSLGSFGVGFIKKSCFNFSFVADNIFRYFKLMSAAVVLVATNLFTVKINKFSFFEAKFFSLAPITEAAAMKILIIALLCLVTFAVSIRPDETVDKGLPFCELCPTSSFTPCRCRKFLELESCTITCKPARYCCREFELEIWRISMFRIKPLDCANAVSPSWLKTNKKI